jgi:ribosomal protein L11 methylase PrmA
VANLTGGLLIALGPRVGGLLRPGGRLVASGFTREDENHVVSALTQGDGIVASREIEDEWVAVSVERGQR